MTTKETNLYDRLVGICADPNDYPTKLFRTRLLPHKLQSYKNLLLERQEPVFTEKPKYPVKFWDYYDGDDNFAPPALPCDNLDRLRSHLSLLGRKDPRCRHIFLQADNSRSPLDCSKEMLCYLLGFLQVMPQFLEVVLAFGTLPQRSVPTAYQNAVFRYEHSIDEDDAYRSGIPELGRSGRVIQNCYNLWSVERSDYFTVGPPWAIRQTGVYHSFDVDNGRALWIHVKVNALMEERIMEATQDPYSLGPTVLRNVTSSFKASLMTRLIAFEWCCEGWQQYIAHWETDLEKSLCKIKFASTVKMEAAFSDAKSIAASMLEPDFVRVVPSRDTTTSLGSRSTTLASSDCTKVKRTGTALTSVRGKMDTILDCQGPKSKIALALSPTASNPTFNPLENFDFKLEDMQHLHYIGTKLQETDMLMKLNINILTENVEYFRTYLKDLQIPRAIRIECRDALWKFLQRTTSIVRELDMKRHRINTLLVMVDDGRVLLDVIVQFRNMELNQLSTLKMEAMTKNMQDITKDMHVLTESMHGSTLNMEQIAAKTEKETSSMHFITLVTLVFLPPTFIATFLGSGVFQWEVGEGQHPPSMPVWKPEYFVLFVMISFPLMSTTVLVWLGATVLRPRLACWLKSCIRRQSPRADEEDRVGMGTQEPSSGGGKQ